MVRGAYMIQERKRADDMGYKDPVCDSKEDTDAQYNKLIETLMHAQTQQRVSFMIASHNSHSVHLATQGMQTVGLPSHSSSVAFGQLLGMKDFITLGLAKHSFNVHKCNLPPTPSPPVPLSHVLLALTAASNRTSHHHTLTYIPTSHLNVIIAP